LAGGDALERSWNALTEESKNTSICNRDILKTS
jgi:hypothetical protein